MRKSSLKTKTRIILGAVLSIVVLFALICILGHLSLRYFDGEYINDIPSLHISKNCKQAIVFVPHQDDDLFVAGPLIYNLRNKGIDTKVVFFTDGNAHDNIGHIRQQEAIKAETRLGVPPDDVICLQFPNRQQADTTDVCGVSSFALRDSMKVAIRKTITRYNPQLIVCSDLDFNRDHRLLAILFDEALGELLKERDGYHPTVLKGFSYQTSYNAVKDFYCMNIISTKKPHDVQNPLYETDVPAYKWTNRVRVPMSGEMVTHASQTNVLYQALEEYRSQWVRDKTRAIINGDNVFWLKRTDNLLNEADVTVSSGEVGRINDFKYYDSNNISIQRKNNLVFSNHLWEADCSDKNPYITISLKKPTKLYELILYDDPTLERNIKKVDLYLDGKYYKTVGPLSDVGLPTRIGFDVGVVASKVELKNFECKIGSPAIVEVELFNKPAEDFVNFSVLKLKNKKTGDFLYRYYIPEETKELELDYYSFGISNSLVTWTIQNKEGSNARLEGNTVVFGDDFTECTVKISSFSNPAIYDEVTLIKETRWNRFVYSFMTTYDQCILDFETAFYRNRIVGSFVRHTTFNPIKRFWKRITE